MSLILLNSNFETAKSFQYSWNILEDVEKDTEYSWGIEEYVERALEYSWSFKAWVEQGIEYSWNISAWIKKQLQYSWNIFATAITSETFVKYEFSSAKRPKAFYINILNKVIGLRAPIICSCERTLSYSWKGFECIPDPAMAWDYATSAETINQSDSVVVAITGLNTPFEWEVSGFGFTLEHATTEGLTNTLHADADSCGTATITVVGCDGVVTVGYVRGAVGQWVHYSDDICELPGVPAICVKNPSHKGITATGTKGRLQQRDIFEYKGLDGHPWSPGSCSAGEYMDCMLMDDFCDGRWCNECPENVACWEPGDPMYVEYWWLVSRITYQWDCPVEV